MPEDIEARDEPAGRDQLAREYQDRIERDKLSPAQVNSELMTLTPNLEFVNYAYEGKGLNPKITTGEGRKMVLFTGTILGPKFGAECLRLGLNNALEIRGSSSFETQKLFLVPYPRFTLEMKDKASEEAKKYGIRGVIFMTLNEKQVIDLKEIVGAETEK
jgi:hypothetical protein